MSRRPGLSQPGVRAAFGAALLFGASTPLAKLLLHSIDPWVLAGLLYLGSGIGLTLYRLATRAPSVRLPWAEIHWLAGAILSGGDIGPVLLMLGLIRMPASGASLLLNAEGVFTATLAWFVFRENFDRRIAVGMVLIVAGATVLSWPGEARFAGIWPALSVLGACLAWGIDNNLTRKVSLADWVASVKGLAAGSVNLVLAFSRGSTPPRGRILVRRCSWAYHWGVKDVAGFPTRYRSLGVVQNIEYVIAPCGGGLACKLAEQARSCREDGHERAQREAGRE